jgi:very-short-patch-repair endonuclease
MLPYNRSLKELSKGLRNNLTEAEKCLWKRLRLKHLGYSFYRQKPIGGYIADFYCPKAKLVVEIDGGQHFTPEVIEYDKVRDQVLRGLGLKILHFSNSDVLDNTDIVTTKIHRYLNKTTVQKRGRESMFLP